MSYMFNVEIEGKANAVFDTADEAVRYATHYVYLHAREFQSAVDILNTGQVFRYGYDFMSVCIVPVAKRRAEVPKLAMYQSVLADNASLRKQLAELEREKSEVYRELSTLAKSVFKRYFYPRDDDYKSGRVVWEVLDDSIGVATQLDNMMAGLMQDSEQLAEKDAEIERLQKLLGDTTECVAVGITEIDELRQQLAGSQAREQQLREALENARGALAYCKGNGRDNPNLMESTCWHGLAAIDRVSQLADTSALESMIAKAGEVMRERCAYEAVRIDSTSCDRACNEIRTLPGVTLEDVK